MQTQPIQYNNNYTIPFGVKIKTSSILEATTMRFLNDEGIKGFKEVTNALNDKPIRAVGNRGYRYYADIFGKQICDKYPNIAKATEEIKLLIKENPNIKNSELKEKIKPFIEKLGNEIDINI
jgi:hypothetical protein